MRIFNLQGEIVKEEMLDAAETVIPINISLQPDGIYLLTLVTKGQLLYQQKIVKE